MAVMITVTVIVLADIALRIGQWDDGATSAGVAVLSVVAGLLVGFGAAYGGTLIFDYGFNVETAGDSPVWSKSERDVLPNDRASVPQ
jgi:hypothetical protein